MRSEIIHMTAMAVLARPMVERNLSGWQMAYQRSTEMNVRVSTDTDTETVCKCAKNGKLEFDTTAKQRQMIKRQVDLVIENLRQRQKKKKEKSAENLQLGVKSSSDNSCQTL